MTATPAAVAASSTHSDFGRAVLAEWTKFRTVRSSYWTLLISTALTVGIGAAVLPFVIDDYLSDHPPKEAATWAVREGWWFEGLHVGIIAVTILGVLVATSEYSTGTIRSTLAAVPSRTRVLAAKVVSFAAVSLVAGAIQSSAAFVIAQPILADRSVDLPLTDPDAWSGVAMATLAVVGAGLIGLGGGLLIRHTAGAIGAVVAMMLVLPGLAALLPASWNDVVGAYPTFAQNAMFTPYGHPGMLAVGPATAVFFGYVAALLVIAGAMFKQRDA